MLHFVGGSCGNGREEKEFIGHGICFPRETKGKEESKLKPRFYTRKLCPYTETRLKRGRTGVGVKKLRVVWDT